MPCATGFIVFMFDRFNGNNKFDNILKTVFIYQMSGANSIPKPSDDAFYENLTLGLIKVLSKK